jgi:hypothetical protein
MGLIDKSGSFSQYTTTTELPDDFLNNITDRIRYHAFTDIDEETIQEQSSGWVDISNMLDNKFETLGFLKEPYIAMSLRIDSRTVPAEALKRYCLIEEERIKIAQNTDFLSKVRRTEIKEQTRLQLLKRVIPASKTYDMIWNYTTGRLIFASTNAKLCDEFQNLFAKTFNIETDSIHPAMLGSDILTANKFSNNDADNFTHFEYIGSDFLTWLWHQINEQKNTFKFKDDSVQIWFDEKVVLQYGSDTDLETVTCIGDSQAMTEIKTAINENKRITQAKLFVSSDSSEWSFVLDAAYLDFKSVKTPKVILNKDDPDGTFYEKMYLLDDIIDIVNTVYSVFVIEHANKLKGKSNVKK